MSARNVFAGAYVDRSGHRRRDTAWLRSARDSTDSVFVPVWGDRCLAIGEPLRTVLLARHDIDAFLADEPIFLGTFGGRPAFAVPIDAGHSEPFPDLGQFHDLRYLGSALPADEANLVAHARALVLWHAAQRYCGRCGAPTRFEAGGNVRVCSNGACNAQLFPRVDPAIIVLVSRGDSCLLGRQADWPENRYSTIAGFVEPGESLEDAVAREVLEETNVQVSGVRYHSSQPWPFPSSLMLGFFATGATTDITLNDGELEDARWFTREELLSGSRRLPYRLSIARRLVDDWLQQADADRD